MRHKFLWRCVAVGALAFVADIVAAVHIRAFVEHHLPLSVGSIIFAQYLAFCGQVWWVDETSTSRRFSITTAAALGAGAGSAVILLF